MKAILDENNFFIAIGKNEGIDIKSIPPADNEHDVKAFKFVNGEWEFSQERHDEITMLNEILSKETLRIQRQNECFPIINRGKPWYDKLSEQQTQELKAWYQTWLDVTDNKTVPNSPEWL